MAVPNSERLYGVPHPSPAHTAPVSHKATNCHGLCKWARVRHGAFYVYSAQANTLGPSPHTHSAPVFRLAAWLGPVPPDAHRPHPLSPPFAVVVSLLLRRASPQPLHSLGHTLQRSPFASYGFSFSESALSNRANQLSHLFLLSLRSFSV